MSWSYNSSTSNLDQIRRLIGDTDTTDQIWSDEEINAEFSISGGVVESAKKLLLGKAAEYSRCAISKKAGSYSEDLKSRAADMRAMAKSLAELGSEPWDETAEQTHSKRNEDEFEHLTDIREG